MKEPRVERLLRWRLKNMRLLIPPREVLAGRTLSSLRPLTPHPRKRKMVARNMAAHAPQVKPKAYLPIWELIPASRKRSRALTKTALWTFSYRRIFYDTGSCILRHQWSCERVPEQRKGEEDTGKPWRQAAAWSKERGKKCGYSEDKGDQVEYPAKPPHVVVISACCTLAVLTEERQLILNSDELRTGSTHTQRAHPEHHQFLQPKRIQLAGLGPSCHSRSLHLRRPSSRSSMIVRDRSQGMRMRRPSRTRSCW